MAESSINLIIICSTVLCIVGVIAYLARKGGKIG